MKVVISTEGNFVSPHFGRCPSFTLFDLENGKITNRIEIENPGHQPGFLPKYFSEKDVNCIIAGGMGRKAKELFDQFNIQQILGISGKIDEVIASLADGTLKGGESLCTHGEGEHDHDHDESECKHC